MASILSLLVGFTLILGQAACQVQLGITLMRVTEGSSVSFVCEREVGNSTLVRWLRKPVMYGVADQQIGCNKNHCFVLDCNHGRNWTDDNYTILNNGTLHIREVREQDSGLYWCLFETPRVAFSICNHNSSLCASQQQEKASNHCRTPPLLFISVLPKQVYKVFVRTGNVLWSGTDAKVFIELCGEFNCVESELKTSTRNPFEQGQEDHFTIDGTYLGNLTHLKIWHNKAGTGPTWLLKKVTVTEQQFGMSYTFTCSCWIDGNSPKTLPAQFSNQNRFSQQISKHQKEDEENNSSVVLETKPLHKLPLPLWELQNRLISNSSVLWLLCGYEGSNKVVSVLCPTFTPCLDTGKREKPQMQTPENDSCPERSHKCLMLPLHVKRNELQKYWCLFGPAENGTLGNLIPSTVSKGLLNESQENSTLNMTRIIATATASVKEDIQNISNTATSILPHHLPQHWKEVIPLVVFPILGVLMIGIFVYLLRRLYAESTASSVNSLRNRVETSQEVMTTEAEQFCLTTPSSVRQNNSLSAVYSLLDSTDIHTEEHSYMRNSDIEMETMYEELQVNITSPSSLQTDDCDVENTFFPEDQMCMYSIATAPGAASEAPDTVLSEGSDEVPYAIIHQSTFYGQKLDEQLL
uniref:Ig-like domain-containing protein n=1 Tax=Eptatretus burgeri TaxID=7764 RepID=A0A8C4QLY1_EPTBU